MAAFTTRSPGSLMPGLPASVTSATFSPRAEPFDDFLAAPGLVELEIAQQRFGDAEMLQQLAGVARVLGGDDVALAQHAQRAQRDVLKIADGRGNEVKRARSQRRQVQRPCPD